MIFALIVLSFAFVLALFSTRRKQKNFPPGPRGLPIIGNVHQMSEEPSKDYMRLQKKYGPIFSVQLGVFRAVVLNEHKLIKETLSMRAVSGRPDFPHFNDPNTNERTGIIFLENKAWEEQRRFVLKNLRDLGFGKKTMENVILDEARILVEGLRKDVGKAICTNDRFSIAVFNALWTIIAGERASQTEEKFKQLVHNLTENSRDAKTFAFLGFFPWYAKLFPQASGLNKFMGNFLPIFNYMREVADSHKQTFQKGTSRDFIDSYLEQIQNTNDKDSSFYKDNGDSNLVMVLYDLFFGGTETSSVTLSWMFLLLAHNPEIQEKLNVEIKSVLGENRSPSLADRPNLPFMEATILEVFRYSSLTPVMTRRTVEDVQIAGFQIPKGTVVLSNLYGVHYDQKMWRDPENFRPQRFLNEDGITIKAFERGYIIPFGTGKRVCPGETMARDTLFLFATSLFQNFRVTLDPTEFNPKIDFSKGTLLRLPTPHKLVLHERH